MASKYRKIVTVIQARMGSNRLPGKVMMTALGRPILALMLERIRRSALAGTIIIATTTNREDDMIAAFCKKENIACFRGHQFDLLERHYKAAIEHHADIVLKIPSDCPLMDPLIIDRTIERYLINEGFCDYVSNLHPATYPDGNDVEVFSFTALERAYNTAQREYEREHTTPFMWNNPEQFRLQNVEWETGLDHSSSHRFVLDYFDDYKFIKRVFEELYPANPNFTLYDILNLLYVKPEIKKINEHLNGINWYSKHMHELKMNLNKHTITHI